MTDRMPWFRCRPGPLLGALAAMKPHEGYVYTVLLLRIYEAGGPVVETARTLSRRTGLTEGKVEQALQFLREISKVVEMTDGRLYSMSVEDELKWQGERKSEQKKAGKASAEKRNKKSDLPDDYSEGRKANENNETAATPVERPFNHIEEEKEKDNTHLASLDGSQSPDGDSEGKGAREQELPFQLEEQKAADDWPRDYRERFWQAYPLKVAKPKALSILERIRKSGNTQFAAIMAGVDLYKRTKPPERDWCHPTTWLNQGRWQDEPISDHNRQERRPAFNQSGPTGVSAVASYMAKRQALRAQSLGGGDLGGRQEHADDSGIVDADWRDADGS